MILALDREAGRPYRPAIIYEEADAMRLEILVVVGMRTTGMA